MILKKRAEAVKANDNIVKEGLSPSYVKCRSIPTTLNKISTKIVNRVQ